MTSIESDLIEWARVNRSRNLLVRIAYGKGMSKERIHQITGLARSTIDRIVVDLDEHCTCCDHKAKDHKESVK